VNKVAKTTQSSLDTTLYSCGSRGRIRGIKRQHGEPKIVTSRQAPGRSAGKAESNIHTLMLSCRDTKIVKAAHLYYAAPGQEQFFHFLTKILPANLATHFEWLGIPEVNYRQRRHTRKNQNHPKLKLF
jgi:hypothetical protein